MSLELMEQTDQQRLETKKSAAPVERRAAVNFFKMLGQPEEYNKPETVEAWAKLMAEAMGYLEIRDLEEFKKFLNWALEENALSAKYLRAARDPAVTLVKNIESLKKFYLAYAKGQEVLNKSKKKPKDANLPAYRQESGKREILKSDI